MGRECGREGNYILFYPGEGLIVFLADNQNISHGIAESQPRIPGILPPVQQPERQFHSDKWVFDSYF